jgi:hypothetical protein
LFKTIIASNDSNLHVDPRFWKAFRPENEVKESLVKMGNRNITLKQSSKGEGKRRSLRQGYVQLHTPAAMSHQLPLCPRPYYLGKMHRQGGINFQEKNSSSNFVELDEKSPKQVLK